MPKTTEEEKITESTPKTVELFRETSHILLESMAVAQEHNMKFVQSTVTNLIDALKSQTEATRTLAQEMERQLRKQTESIQKLEPGLLEGYINLLRAPISSYQQVLDAVEKSTQQGRKVVDHAITSFEKAEGDLLRNASGRAPK